MAEPAFRVPQALSPEREEEAVSLLRGYYDHDAFYSGGGFSGGFFDEWDPTGTRGASVDVFTPDDLQAVGFLSVEINPRAAIDLLHRRAHEFADALRRVDPDVDLVDVAEEMGASSPAGIVYWKLRELSGVGPTRAGKLLARKRPRLVPIYDRVIDEHVLAGSGRLWEPLRQALRRNDRRLHHHLLYLRDAAGLPHAVTALRVFDVSAWREGVSRARQHTQAAGGDAADSPEE